MGGHRKVWEKHYSELNWQGRRTEESTKALSHSLLGTLPDSRLAPLLGS